MLDSAKFKQFADNNFKSDENSNFSFFHIVSKDLKMVVSSAKRGETLWKNETLLVTDNFSFSHKRLVLHTLKKGASLEKS